MQNYIYQNNLISKKQLRELLAWSFTNYDSMQACSLADELKSLGFKYASKSGISISIEDLKVPFLKNIMVKQANKSVANTEKIFLKGRITEIERFEKIINIWNLTSEALKTQIVDYFKSYDPLNSVYIMAFSGARGNLTQVRQLVGMRGLMSDPSGQMLNQAITKNFREGLTVTDYLMSSYGARKGVVDTSLKTANSGYLTRRLIDVAQDIIIREKDCGTTHSFLFSDSINDCENILGRILSKSVFDLKTNKIIANKNTQITPTLIKKFKEKNITQFYVRSPFTCNLYRAICQKCYGWDLAYENLVDIGEAIGILAGQSIGEPGTQLTMRTFHTGGIFTAGIREQIYSPADGIIRYGKNLKCTFMRTNRGDDVRLTTTSGNLIIIPELNKQELTKVKLLPNTILFPKNNQYISTNSLLGEKINPDTQLIIKFKPIVSHESGETYIPPLNYEMNSMIDNKWIWIFSGQLYNSPTNSFINLNSDFKLNKDCSVFRGKIINHYSGFVNFINTKNSLSEKLIRIKNKKNSLINSELQKLKSPNNLNNYLLNLDTSKYLIKINDYKSKCYLTLTRSENFGTLITNTFQTLTGGIVYYNYNNLWKNHDVINYIQPSPLKKRYQSFVYHRSIIWLGEEIHKVNCEQNILLVEDGDFISKEFELIPGLFSKTSGLVTINKPNNIIETISIKSGFVYEGKIFKNTAKKVYYPGEIILGNINVKNLSVCEQIVEKDLNQLLLRPVEIYEFPYSPNSTLRNNNSMFTLNPKLVHSYKSGQLIKSIRNVNLASTILIFKTNKLVNNNNIVNIELSNNKKTNSVNFNLIERICLNNFITPDLRYQNIQPCFLIQENQFISSYTTLGYLQAITDKPLEIVRIIIKYKTSKQIFVISNRDCLTVTKEKSSGTKLNEIINSTSDLTQIGKIIFETKNHFILQRGQLYLFPNCANQVSTDPVLKYQVIPSSLIQSNFITDRDISLNYSNILQLSVKKKGLIDPSSPLSLNLKTEFSKLFLKKNGKLYCCLAPQFFKKLSITDQGSKLRLNHLISSNKSKKVLTQKLDRTLLLKSSKRILNKNKASDLSDSPYQMTLVKFVEQPFKKSTKAVGLYSITEDFFEKDLNTVFCNDDEFIEAGRILGFVRTEREITGDIVQGLPRIEEMLEARKRNINVKRTSINRKKGLISNKCTLTLEFDFKKLGTILFGNDRVNPHKLLKVYFNYYGFMRVFLCDRTNSFKFNRLINSNYEGSYQSFKKVQTLVLNSVQNVYYSQGVRINNKHLEVIIKQMTTKVLITYEGDSPLSRREVIDLYHIQYINEILTIEKKQPVYYIPLLLGITKAALNNPSFISAASFQETTRVLTKAAIEGRIDWLRGLKENIIIGQLIPAGTGFQSYRKSFKKIPTKKRLIYKSIKDNPNPNPPRKSKASKTRSQKMIDFKKTLN